MRNLIERINRTVNEGFASPMRIAVSKGMLDFIWHPLDGELEVGLGGEWWTGQVPLRDGEVAQFHHRKEGVDPAYRPVKVSWERQNHGILFRLMGGFLSDEATVLVGATKVVSEGREQRTALDADTHEAVWGLGAAAARAARGRLDVEGAFLAAVRQHGTKVFPAARVREDDPWFAEYFQAFRDGAESEA